MLVSVIIPAFNASQYIGESIESALRQTHKQIEIIVVDDGSIDATAQVARDFGDKVHVISQDNAGCSAARNTGAQFATGTYVAFLDADDLWEPNKLTAQLVAISPQDGFSYTERRNFGDLGALSELQSDSVKQHSGNVFRELLTEGNFVTTSSVLMPRAWFLELGGFNPQLTVAEDWELWLRSAKLRPVSFCSQPLVRYRVHAGNISQNNVRMMHEAQNRIIDSSLQTLDRSVENRELYRLARLRSAEVSTFFAANAGQWSLALRLSLIVLRMAPTRFLSYKTTAKCILRRA
jgi:glycosyltransferase involved in cell wall biosynthesis